MGYRTILVDLTADGPVEGRLHAARSLASRFDAKLVGLHVTPPIELTAWQGGWSVYIPPQVAEAQRKANQEAKARVRAVFDRACGADPAMAWREAEGDPSLLLAEAAHTSDLVVTAMGGTLGTPERIVMAAGVPVLTVPPDTPHDFGHVALVAWKGTREAARAAHDALPFLRTARHVVLCTVGEQGAASLDEAAAMLDRHGVAVHLERVGGTEASAGEILLAQATAHGADLLVMGAYGHARVREVIFGGATHQVLREATLPVLFSG
jgi:nucleotide-binding universal stress UspA family protein